MLSLLNFRWFCLYFLFGQFNVSYIRTAWPPSDSSNIQLLGLFSYILNRSEHAKSSLHAEAMFKAAIVLSQEYNIKIEGQHIGWKSAQTEGDVINALSKTCHQLISTSNIVGIVGPELSRESHFIAPFAAKVRIPVISYGATDPELSDRNAYPAFYRTVPSDNAAALAIVKLFLLFNWTSCLIIYQNDAFGLGGAKTITETFNKNNLTVTQMIVFDIPTHTIRDDLKSLPISSSTRIVLVWAEPEYTTLILQNALDNDVVGPRFTWILNSNIQWNSFNSTFYDKLIGILIVEPVVGNVVNAPINETLLNKAYDIWEQYENNTFPGRNDVDYYALFAFDATWTLIQSLQQFCSKMIQNSGSCISFNKTSSCFDRQLFNSDSLFNAINNMRFLGVSGSIEFGMNVTDRINGTYYVAKNVQGVWKDLNNNRIVGLNSNPVLVWSETNGWISHRQANVIIWPGNTLKAPSGYASISGITLQIAIIESPPFTMVTNVTNGVGEETQKFVGYVPDLIELLQKKMGFNSSITLVPSHETYNILVDAVEKGIYDMVVADMTVTAGRMKKVDFSSAIFDNSLRIIVREASSLTNIDLLSYLRPFSFNVWIALLFATLYAGFLICLLEREHNEALRNKSISSLIVKSMWYSLGTILGFGVDFNIRTPTGRLLTIGLYILSLVSVSAYTAKLAAELTIAETKRNMISGIDDIKNGKIPSNRIGILTNTSIQDYYLREFSGNNVNFYPLESEKEMYDKLLDNTIDASIMDSGFLEYATSNIYCNLTLIGADFDKTAFGIAFQKNWLYKEVFNLNILSLRESGDLDELKRKWFQTNYCSHLSPIFTSMTIESMAGLFLTFGTINLGNTPSSDVPIFTIIFLSTIFHSLFFYFLPSSLTSLGKSYIISTFHAIICVSSVVNFFSRYSINLKQINRISGGGVYGTGDEIMAYSICYSLGYFIYDLLLMLLDKSVRTTTALVHHVLVIIGIFSGIMSGVCHPCHFYLLAEELSTIPLNLKSIYYNQPHLHKIFTYLFVFSFVLIRLIYGSIICAYAFRTAPRFFRLASDIGDTISFINGLAQVTLCISARLLNIYWAILILQKLFHSKQSNKKSS